ncbi:MAG: LysR family transcriptional regulator [Treponema sp.]|nr:LysR family transcriptional regulator [Treponema sp.]
MNDRQLKYVLTIAKEGSITGAAEKLNISQPSLSNLLAAVERDIGAKIFDRSLSPMRLTYEGEKYVEAAEKILSTYNDLRCQVEDCKDPSKGRLSIGCGPHLSSILIPAILPVLIQQYPGVEYELTENPPAIMRDQLLSGMLDVVFSTRMLKHSAVECKNLYREEMVLLAPQGVHPETSVRSNKLYPVARLQSLGNAPFVLMKSHHQLRILAEQIFAKAGFVPAIMLETDNWETCFRMVESGIALTILPADARRDITSEKVQKFSVAGNCSWQTFLCYRKNAHFSKVTTEFIQLAHTILGHR